MLTSVRQRMLARWCPPNSRALEVGCADGVYTLPLAEIASHVDAIDIDLAATQRLLAKLPTGIRNVQPICGDFPAWAVTKNDSYDFGLCTGTIMLMNSRERRELLQTFHMVLKDNGRLLIDFYTPAYLLYRIAIQRLPLSFKVRSLACLILRKNYLTAKIFEQEIRGAGLRVLADRNEINFPGSFYYQCRELDGFRLDTVFGNYFQTYLLGKST